LTRALLIPGLLLLAAGSGFSQAAPKTQVFEAADVHPTTSASDDLTFLANGRLEARGVTLLRLIAVAYSMSPNLVSGGPSWLDTDRYDVIGKSPGEATAIAQRYMLQSLLAERFHLSVKNEEKPMPALVLTLAKKGVARASDGKGDPSCKRAVEDMVISLTCQNLTMAGLAEQLPGAAPGYFNLPTTDKTGMAGAFNFRLEWKGRGQLTGPSDSMSLFNAIEKQLGVKVEQQSIPVAVVSVLSVDRAPTPNAPDVTEKLGKAPTEFEVVDIRPSRPGETEDFRLANGRIDAKAIQIKDMVLFAYDLEDDWIRGAEKWLETDRYDIVAKTAPTESADTLRVLVQAMLADRFKLKVHKETQPVTVYGLTANKSKLKEADPSSRSTCLRRVIDGAVGLTCTNTTMEQFAKRIREVAGGYLEHPVVDLTELKGAYDFTVAWARRNRTLGNGPRMPDTPAEAGGAIPVASDRAAGLTVFEAVDRQLGLKLAPVKHPMQVLVIDSMQRLPTEN
jgi:uncharacterized protein (TIGR03435 family)